MDTIFLSGASQFTLEAWNYLWRHKWFLCTIAFLPWALEVTGEYTFGMNNFNADFFLDPINRIFQAFWAMIWLGSILRPTHKPTLRTYFQVNINHAWYILYALALSAPTIVISLTLKNYGTHLGLIFLSNVLASLFTLPFSLLFPALSMGKPIFIRDIWNVSRPFWKDFFKSSLIGLFLTLFMLAILFLLISTVLPLLPLLPYAMLFAWLPAAILEPLSSFFAGILASPQMPILLGIAADNLFGIWANAFLLTIAGLYYKRYLME